MSRHPYPVCTGPGLYRSPAAVQGRVTALLATLGDTPEQVAANLDRAGCLGVPGDCRSCPVAVYLWRSDLKPREVFVCDIEVCLIFDGDEDLGRDVEYVKIPDPVTQFIHAFDQGQYWPLAKTAATAGEDLQITVGSAR